MHYPRISRRTGTRRHDGARRQKRCSELKVQDGEVGTGRRHHAALLYDVKRLGSCWSAACCTVGTVPGGRSILTRLGFCRGLGGLTGTSAASGTAARDEAHDVRREEGVHTTRRAFLLQDLFSVAKEVPAWDGGIVCVPYTHLLRYLPVEQTSGLPLW